MLGDLQTSGHGLGGPNTKSLPWSTRHVVIMVSGKRTDSQRSGLDVKAKALSVTGDW